MLLSLLLYATPYKFVSVSYIKLFKHIMAALAFYISFPSNPYDVCPAQEALKFHLMYVDMLNDVICDFIKTKHNNARTVVIF